MITYAIARKEELSRLLHTFAASQEAMWWSPHCFIDFDHEIESSTWNKLQLISVHGNEIKGFLSASISRETHTIYNISTCKFCDGHELLFATDMSKVFRFLCRHFRYIRWSVVAGSLLEPIYRRIASEFGGTEIGRFPYDVRLRDGRLADIVWLGVPGNKEADGVTMLPPDFEQ